MSYGKTYAAASGSGNAVITTEVKDEAPDVVYVAGRPLSPEDARAHGDHIHHALMTIHMRKKAHVIAKS